MNIDDGRVIETLKPRRMPEKFKTFPVECLPEPIWTYVVEGAKTLVCDPAFIALPILSILASAVGNSRSIKLKESWCEPSILWTAVIAESGSMKTPAISYAMEPLKKLQIEAFNDYDEKLAEYEELKREYDNQIKTRGKNDVLPDEPAEPIAARYFCNDATIEAIASILNNAPRGILQACDELGTWINGFNAYKSGSQDQSRWLELYQSGMLLVDRKSGNPKTIRILNASVSICGGIQPAIIKRSFTREFYDNGIAARFLMAMPPRQPKKWLHCDIDGRIVAEVEAVFRKLVGLQMEYDDISGFTAKPLPLTIKAQDMFVAYYNDHGAEQAELSGDLAAVWSKLEATAARLALIFHCVRAAAEDPGLTSPDYIDDDSIIAGVMVVNWFKDELKRIYAVLSEGEIEHEQRQLIELVRSRGGKMSSRDLMRASRKYRGSSAEAEEALQELVDIGWGRWENVPAGPEGGKPTRHFIIAGDNTLDAAS